MTECSHCNIQDTDQSCISLVPIFSNLTHSEIHKIAQITTSRNFEKGEIIFMAGDKGDRDVYKRQISSSLASASLFSPACINFRAELTYS